MIFINIYTIHKNMMKEESSSKAGSDFTSTTSAWSRLKDPRIVRVSRAVGGKDRHSKVCTVRGLRDRRVRLSVPTAIQLYDLQERLGLNQPSKVVDWLLNVAKNDIDGLPPLQIPQPFCFGEKHPLSNEQGHEFHPQNPSSFATLMSSNLSLSQTPISLGLASHQHQDFAYQTAPYYPSFHSSEFSNSSQVRPSDFNMNADLLPSQNKRLV